jgi:hypothetical protein
MAGIRWRMSVNIFFAAELCCRIDLHRIDAARRAMLHKDDSFRCKVVQWAISDARKSLAEIRSDPPNLYLRRPPAHCHTADRARWMIGTLNLKGFPMRKY